MNSLNIIPRPASFRQQLGPLELEVADNPSDRLLALFVLDKSSSMAGQPISELNRCFRQLVADLQEDAFTNLTVELAVVTVGSVAELTMPPVQILQIEPGSVSALHAGGNTALGSGLEIATATILDRLNHYRRVGLGAYRPCIFVLSDGRPTDAWQDPANRLRVLAERHRWAVYCVGLGACDLRTLARIAPAHLPPQRLRDELKLSALFRWVRDSLASYSKSQGGPVTLPPIHPWASP